MYFPTLSDSASLRRFFRSESCTRAAVHSRSSCDVLQPTQLARLLLGFFAFLFLVGNSFAQDAAGPSRPSRTLLQPEMEAQLEAGEMKGDDFMTGTWGGTRARMHAAGI